MLPSTADLQDRAATREVSGVEIVALRLDHLFDERYLASDFGPFVLGSVSSEIVDELLPIV